LKNKPSGNRLALLKQSKQAEQAKQQQEDKVLINVDADVIEVEAAELYKMGVSPIGQGKNSVRLRRISQCLKEGKAKVICGVTLSVVDGEQASAKQECQKRIRIKEDPRRDIYINIEEALSFRVSAKGITEDKIFLQFSFNQTYYETPEEPNEATRPPMINRDWNSYLTLKPGTPKITGRIQEGKKSYFLIMSADVED